MHSAVMQNKDYIKFADKSTVEVIALGQLQKGIDRGDRKASTYKKKVNGEEVELLVEFPNLTVAEVMALRNSKASSYNDTGKIPFTALVDPHTEKEMVRWSGGTSGSTIMDRVKDVTKTLKKSHGKGISRKELGQLSEAIAESQEEAVEGEYSKAMTCLTKAGKKSKDWPQVMQQKLEKARAAVIQKANTQLDEIEAYGELDPVEAKKKLNRLKSKLRGTGLESRSKELVESLSAS